MIHSALTIAGSDPSGGAGIQADLRVFSVLDVYGMAVITSLTAQNTVGVRGVMPVPPDFVEQQLDVLLSDISPVAVKTGMLGDGAVVEVVARKIRQYHLRRLVVDPVLVSTSGTRLLDADGIEILKSKLMPLAELITPNLAEAAELTGTEVRDIESMERAARSLHQAGAQNVLVKGGHLEGDAIDVFFDGSEITFLKAPRIPCGEFHGTGCVFSAAITAELARGAALAEAINLSKALVTSAIEQGVSIGSGAPIAHFQRSGNS